MIKNARVLIVLAAVAGAAGAALAAGQITITSPEDGATLQAGTVVHITWRNVTTNPVTIWLTWPGHRTQLGESDEKTDGMLMWRATKLDAGAYAIVVEDKAGTKATVNVAVVGDPISAPSLPSVYATPNPFDLSSGGGQLTFSGVPSGSKVTVYDMEGREVKAITGDPLTWDGRNERGDMVAAGTYLFVVELAAGGKTNGKIAVVK